MLDSSPVSLQTYHNCQAQYLFITKGIYGPYMKIITDIRKLLRKNMGSKKGSDLSVILCKKVWIEYDFREHLTLVILTNLNNDYV